MCPLNWLQLTEPDNAGEPGVGLAGRRSDEGFHLGGRQLLRGRETDTGQDDRRAPTCKDKGFEAGESQGHRSCFLFKVTMNVT